MKLLRHRGFTLSELLIGMVLTFIIIGSVSMVVKVSLDIYAKTDAKSIVVDGVRFTADSFRRRITPLLDNATEIQLLGADYLIPDIVSDDNHYIYLSNERVKYKSASDDIAFEGSELIKSLNFELPTSSEDIAANYILKMDIVGRNDNDSAKVKLDLTIKSPLYNKPVKSGALTEGNNFLGKTLRFVVKQKSSEPSKGPRLWDEWTENLKTGAKPDSFFETTVPNTDLTIGTDPVTGKTLTIKVNTKNDNQPGRSVTVAEMDETLLEGEKRATLGLEDDKSYTTLTNYSLIVDAELNNDGDGYALLISGTSITENQANFKDCGYMLQIDKTIDSFTMRLFANGEQHSDEKKKNYGMSLHYEEAGDNLNKKISGVGPEKNPSYGPFYGPGHMKNSIFRYITNDNAKLRPEQEPWTKRRRRFVVTVLEYYLNGEGKNNPRFIIRMKLLKDFDPNNNDPWQMDKDAFYSEPIWFGGFVSSSLERKYEKQTRSRTSPRLAWSPWSGWQPIQKSEYDTIPPDTDVFQTRTRQISGIYSVKNHSLYSGNYSNEIPTGLNNNAYVAKMPWGDIDGNANSDFLVFNAEEMNVKSDVSNSSFFAKEGTVTTGIKTSIINKFNTPTRTRYIGIRAWGHKNKTTEVKIYSLNFGPGFRKSELLAIMPLGARMYELNDTNETNILGSAQENLNKGLFGSIAGFSAGDGNGSGYSGVMDIQHVMGACNCPMCKYPLLLE